MPVIKRFWFLVAGTLFSLAISCSAACSPSSGGLCTSRQEPQQEQRALVDDQEILKLIDQLDSEKYITREEALQKLSKVGLPAAKALIGATLDPQRSYEVRNRCLKILVAWSKQKDEQQFAAIANLLAANSTKKGNYSDELRMLREHYHLDLSSNPKVVLEKLRAGGVKITASNGNPKTSSGNLQIEAFHWRGPMQELAYFGRIKQPATLRIAPPLLNQVIDYLPKSDIRAIFVTRAPSQTKFRRIPVTPGALDESVCRKLHRIRSLKRLDFIMVRVPKQGFQHLARCTDLESLTLPTGTTDDDLAFLASLKSLREIKFHNTFEVKGEGLQHLAELKEIEKLELFYTNISGKSLKHLTKLPKLKYLYAPQVHMDDHGMRHLAKIESLEELRLDNTAVTNDGLVAIAKLPRLRSLALVSGSFSNSGVMNLLTLPKLQSVTASAGLITEDIKQKLKAQSASFQISGQFFKPNSPEEYQAIEALLKRGLRVVQYPRPNSMALQLFPNSWRGDNYSDIQLISKLHRIKHLRFYIYGDQPVQLIDKLIEVDCDFEVRVNPERENERNVLREDLAEKLKNRFPAKVR